MSTCLKINIRRFKKKTTWQVLDEVDALMAHVPSWNPFSWHKDYVKNFKFDYKNKGLGKKHG